MMMMNINIWASLVAAVVAFILGGLWYSKFLFGGMSDCGKSENKSGHGAFVLIMSFIFSFIAAIAMSWLLGPTPPMDVAIKTGLLISIFWIGTAVGTNFLFSNYGFKHFIVNAGYFIAQYVLFGVVFGLWH
jgi:hypothetical protein